MPLRPSETCSQLTGTGFVPQPAVTETATAYGNTVDLGFGREMHCVQDGANAACYAPSSVVSDLFDAWRDVRCISVTHDVAAFGGFPYPFTVSACP